MLQKVMCIAFVICLTYGVCAADVVLFDDFNDPAWTAQNWEFRGTHTCHADCCEEVVQYPQIVDGVLVLQGPCDWSCNSWAIFLPTYSDYYRIEARMKMAPSYNNNFGISWHVNTGGNGTRFECLKGGDNYFALADFSEWLCAGAHGLVGPLPHIFEDDHWYNVTVEVRGGGTPGTDSVYCTLEGSTLYAGEVSSMSHLGRAGICFSWANTVYCDWFRVTVTGVVSTEPTSWGAVKSLYR